MVYLVADFWAEPPANIPPHWRVVGYFDSVVHAARFASLDSIVTEWKDNLAAWKTYKSKRLPREADYRILP